MSVGENVKRMRLEKGWSQEDLAEAVQVSRPMICQIERGSKVPSVMLARDIAEVLGCRLEDLVDEVKS